MAKRPVYLSENNPIIFSKILVEFQFYSGFSIIQKQKSILSLHDAFLMHNPNKKILEISTKSTNSLGVKLSAFNLSIKSKTGKKIFMESLFQASKIFQFGGPYKELLYERAEIVRKDPRLRTSGNLIGFRYNQNPFPIIPKTFFYNWLYVNFLYRNSDLALEIMNYDGFTDIEFNPDRQINCQAEAAAVFVSLKKQELLEKALANKKNFCNIVYKNKNENFVQNDLFSFDDF